MKFEFYKYQGTGNDFVMIDNRNNVFDSSNVALVVAMCDRKFGIGADGLMLINKHAEADFELIYFNSDGSKSLCGNGSRCAVMFARVLGIVENETSFLAIDGMHDAFIKEDLVHLKMHDVKGIEMNDDFSYVNTGSPHYVAWVNNISKFPVYEEGKKIRYSARFSEKGTNVNFIERTGDVLNARTYERGVENETLSCGTGVTACAIVASTKGMTSPVKLKTLGGDLQVTFTKTGDLFTDIFLIGPAKMVFKGNYEIA